MSPSRVICNTVGATGGALLGSTFGSPVATAAGAGAGLLLSETLHTGSTAAQKRSYAVGYEKGRSDAAKQQFQLLNDQQRFMPGLDQSEEIRLVEVPLPEREINGVTFAPSTATLRIHE